MDILFPWIALPLSIASWQINKCFLWKCLGIYVYDNMIFLSLVCILYTALYIWFLWRQRQSSTSDRMFSKRQSAVLRLPALTVETKLQMNGLQYHTHTCLQSAILHQLMLTVLFQCYNQKRIELTKNRLDWSFAREESASMPEPVSVVTVVKHSGYLITWLLTCSELHLDQSTGFKISGLKRVNFSIPLEKSNPVI